MEHMAAVVYSFLNNGRDWWLAYRVEISSITKKQIEYNSEKAE